MSANASIIALRVIPKASRNEIVGWVEDAGGGAALKIKIRQAPEDGKATKALITFLAKEWKVPEAMLEIVSGETSRHKRLKIHSEPLCQRLLQEATDARFTSKK